MARVEHSGAEAWPSVRVSTPDLRRGLLDWSRLSGNDLELDGVDLGEVFIAVACAAKLGPALSAFEARYIASAQVALSSYRLSPDERAEILQRVRVRLFVETRSGLPVILHSVGAGRLGGLVRVVMVREALRLRAKTPSAVLPLPNPLGDADLGPSPERGASNEQRQALASAAFERAAADLSSRQRLLLRLHYTRGISVAKIGSMYEVHRGTAFRWLAAARNALRAAFLTHLHELAPDLLGPRTRDAGDVDAWFNTHLELSLSRVLADPQ